MGKSQPATELLALVDLGSNALRCALARLDTRPGFELLRERRTQTRLGAHHTDVLPRDAIEATSSAVAHFLEGVRRKHGAVRVLGVATAAVRDAQNREALLAPLADLGVTELRILSGAEEGRLGAEAALRALPIDNGMVIDLGGGSLQITPVQHGGLQASQSVPLGVARLLHRFIESDPASPSELAALRAEVRERALPLLPPAPANGRALATGGVVGALAQLAVLRTARARGLPLPAKPQTHGFALSYQEVRALRAWLEPMTLHGRSTEPGVKPERADVIVVGAIVFEELLERSGYSELTVSRTSVREAVLWGEAVKLPA